MELIDPHRFPTSAQAFDGFGNRSRSFNGTSDYLTLGDVLDETDGGPLSGASTQFTIAAWVKATTSDAAGTIVGKYGSGSGRDQLLFYYLPSGAVRFGWWSGSGVFQIEETTATPINASTWTHIAVEFDGTQADPDDCVTIYIDGTSATLDATPITNSTPTSAITNRTIALQIGAALTNAGAPAFKVDGLLADVRIYDALIGSSAVNGLSNGTDVQTNLVGHWLTDADNVLDVAGSNNGTNFGSTYSYDNPSPPVEFGSASRVFNGSSDYIDCGDILDSVWSGTGKKFTFATWIKTDALDDGIMLSKLAGTSNGRTFYVRVRTNGELGVLLYQTGSSSSNRFGRETSTSGSISAGVWTHCAFVYDQTAGAGNFLKMYIDGVESTTLVDYFSSGSFTGIFVDNATPVQISGFADGTAAPFGGYLADMRIYDTDLTASQISDLYAGTDVQTNLIGHWLTDNDDVEDKAGTNDGTNYGSAYSDDNPPMDLIPFGQKSRFFSSDYINTNTGFQSVFQSSFSISTWVRFDDGIPSNNQMLFGNQSAAPVNRVLIFLDTAGALTFGYFSNGLQARAEIDQNFANGDTGWFHYTAVVEPAGITIYKDGLVQTLDATDDGDMSAVTMGDYGTDIDCYIGARNNNGSPDLRITGNVADFRIYDSALSASDVTKIYNRTDDKSNIYAWYITNSNDVLDHAGTNDGTNNGSTWSTDIPS